VCHVNWPGCVTHTQSANHWKTFLTHCASKKACYINNVCSPSEEIEEHSPPGLCEKRPVCLQICRSRSIRNTYIYFASAQPKCQSTRQTKSARWSTTTSNIVNINNNGRRWSFLSVPANLWWTLGAFYNWLACFLILFYKMRPMAINCWWIS